VRRRRHAVKGVGDAIVAIDAVEMIDRPDDHTDGTDPRNATEPTTADPADAADATDHGALDGDDFTELMSDGEAEADDASGATHGGRVADA
jgi:hypothetical protein